MSQQIPVGSKVKTATGQEYTKPQHPPVARAPWLSRRSNTRFERVISAAEVAKHAKDDDCWMIIHGKVYDVTGFLVDHPGGPEILTNEGGIDATAKFEEVFHSDDARHQLKDFCVGVLEGYDGPLDAATNRGKKASSSGQAQASQGVSPVVYLLAAAGVAAMVYLFVL